MKATKFKTIQFFAGAIAVTGALLLWGCNDREHMSGTHHEGVEDEHVMTEEDAGQHHENASDGTTENNAETIEPSGSLVDGVRVVEMTARKFEFDPEKVIVKQGEKVHLKVTSEDVMHGIGIAAYDIDKKLPSNETVTMEFTADEPGTHHFHCSVYCGAGHDRMHGEIVVLPAAE